jgi:hypothetical protein
MTRESILKHALSLSPDERVRLVDELLASIVDSIRISFAAYLKALASSRINRASDGE